MIRLLPLWLLLALAAPLPAAAQATAVHGRARANGETTLALANVRLQVPRNAVERDAMLALGVGSVPATDAAPLQTGVVVSASGGLRAPAVLLIAPTDTDRARAAGGTPALREVASGQRLACAAAGAWVACPVLRPGAYLLDVTAEPPATDPLLRTALTGTAAERPEGARSFAAWLVVVATAGVAGALTLWLSGRQRGTEGGERRAGRPS